MKNVVGYVRISSASQIDNTSIETQKEKIEMHCKLYDFNLVKIFIDEAKSAKEESKREGYNSMLDYVLDEEHNINAIVVFKNDRLHRSLYNLLKMIYKLQENKIDLISVTEQFDTGTAQGMLFIQMLGSFSEFERKIINERTKNGRISKGKNEQYAGGRIAFGYELVNNSELKIKEEEAAVIKDIFKLRSKGMSLSKIGEKYKMAKQRIDYIIKNPLYRGVYEYNGLKEKNNIIIQVEPIVSTYMWNKANKTTKPKTIKSFNVNMN